MDTVLRIVAGFVRMANWIMEKIEREEYKQAGRDAQTSESLKEESERVEKANQVGGSPVDRKHDDRWVYGPPRDSD